jgi:nitronate monooxygenase
VARPTSHRSFQDRAPSCPGAHGGICDGRNGRVGQRGRGPRFDRLRDHAAPARRDDDRRIATADAQADQRQLLLSFPGFFCHSPAKADAEHEQAWRDRLLPYYRELGIDQESLPRLDIAPFGEAMCQVVEDTRPDVVSFHFGLPAADLVARIKAAGCLVMSSATTVQEARWLEAHGVDAVIAQGAEAGGHRGTFLAGDPNRAVASQSGTLALVPQIADAVSVPIIAAGGIADGRGIAAAVALGASGVQIGTAFLLCPEAATSPLHRDALRHARETECLLTNVFTGRPARVLANRLPLELGPLLDVDLDFPLPMGALAPLRAKAEQQGNSDFTPLWSGRPLRWGRRCPPRR